MLEEIIEDDVDHASASNQPIFSKEVDYEALLQRRREIQLEWKSLRESGDETYKDQETFERDRLMPDLKAPGIIPAKNYSILLKEAKSRINSDNYLQLLSLDSLDFDDSVLELAESLENAPDIRKLYKLRKKTTGDSPNAGINAEESSRLKNCFSQGRELYLAGKNGSLMVKPLNFFYAITAYAYGIIVLNNPIRYSKGNIPGSHGLSYLPDTIRIQFGGDTARGTFSDLVTSFPTQLIKNRRIEIHQDCTNSVFDFYNNKFTVSLGTLLSMIPEMSEYYKLTTGKNSRAHPIEIVNANDTRSVRWEFQIGNGEHRPSRDDIERSFSGFEISERHGKYVVIVPATESHKISACIYTDIRGDFWYIENPFHPVILPEICTHFLISSMFSNIMRYRPDEWGSILLNEVSSEISLITRHYFSSFERKFFILMLRSASRYIPHVSSS